MIGVTVGLLIGGRKRPGAAAAQPDAPQQAAAPTEAQANERPFTEQ